jgi:L-rhamnose-H+ transport protein
LFLTALFGFLWGIGCQLFGLAISMVGNSLGFALILGLAATLGSAIPLVILHTSEVATKAGIWNFTGLGLAVIALVATVYAGILKDRDLQPARQLLNADESPEASFNGRGSFTLGVVISVLSGFFSACLNLATSFGHDIADAAEANGASKSMRTNAIYCVSIVAGSVPNLVYCTYIMRTKGEFPFAHGASALLKSVLATVAMGILWFGSNVAYGVATTLLPGDLGTVVGWPIYIIGMVLFASISGIVQGEWRGTRCTTKAWMAVGLTILCLAIVAVGLAG